MPLLRLELSKNVGVEEKQELLKSLSKLVSEGFGKPEQYVMITIANAAISMSGTPAEGAFVDIRGIGGFSEAVNKKVSKSICTLLSQRLAIQPQNIYINFTDVGPENWGWNNSTFA